MDLETRRESLVAEHNILKMRINIGVNKTAILKYTIHIIKIVLVY